jgi:ribonuclease P protein component
VLPAGACRLRRAEFTATVRDGVRAGAGAVVLHLRVATDAGSVSPRVGFVVSRSVGTAVVRNRVRRRLRHLVRPRLVELPAGSDLVVRATPASASASGAELERQLDRGLATALARAGR